MRFVCCERAKEAGKGRVFWCVQIEMADSDGVREVDGVREQEVNGDEEVEVIDGGVH